MFAAIAMAFTLIGAQTDGLDCQMTERCHSGICDSVEAPLMVLFSPTAVPGKPAIFLLGDRRLFEGEPVSQAAVPAMTRMFPQFRFQPDAFVYAPGAMGGYDPGPGSVQVLVGGRALNVAGDGRAEVFTIREGLPGLDWITSFSGQCRPRGAP